MKTGRIFLARTSDIPSGTMKLVSMDGHPVLVVHAGGRFSAVAATCTHEAEPLSEGYLTESAIVCAYHGSEFDLLTGEAIGPPADDPLTVYPLTIKSEQIYADLPTGDAGPKGPRARANLAVRPLLHSSVDADNVANPPH